MLAVKKKRKSPTYRRKMPPLSLFMTVWKERAAALVLQKTVWEKGGSGSHEKKKKDGERPKWRKKGFRSSFSRVLLHPKI